MSEASIEANETDRIEQGQGLDPAPDVDPELAQAIGPEASPVPTDQAAGGRDAVPQPVAQAGAADAAEQGRPDLAAESIDTADPGDEGPD